MRKITYTHTNPDPLEISCSKFGVRIALESIFIDHFDRKAMVSAEKVYNVIRKCLKNILQKVNPYNRVFKKKKQVKNYEYEFCIRHLKKINFYLRHVCREMHIQNNLKTSKNSCKQPHKIDTTENNNNNSNSNKIRDKYA